MTQLAVLDFETTGLVPGVDEILQVSIIDENGQVLLNEYCCPKRHTSWNSAQKINGISPQQVANKPAFEELCEAVREVLANAQQVIAYNMGFEQSFLQAYGIAPSSLRWGADPMVSFAQFFDGQKRALTAVAGFFGFAFEAHNALEDVRATLHSYRAMEGGSLLAFVTQDAQQTQQDGLQYHAIEGEQRVRMLKLLGLCPFTFAREKPLVYQGVFAAKPQACDVVGFQNKSRENDWLVLVLRVDDQLLCVCDDYLREMQSPTFKKETGGEAMVRTTHARMPQPKVNQSTAAATTGKFAAFAQKSGAIKNLRANTQANPKNPFYEKSVVFTGDMAMPRDEAAQAVSQLGATVKSGVSAKTHYLVVGAQDKALVGDDGISGKEEKARALNESKKASIQLLQEADFKALLQSAREMESHPYPTALAD